jgi:hypothetical protein
LYIIVSFFCLSLLGKVCARCDTKHRKSEMPTTTTTTTTTTQFVVAVIIILGFRCQYIIKSTAASSIRTTDNPYRTGRVRLEENEAAENEEDEIHTTNEMGIQSQRREGSILSCKRRATTAKYRRTNLVQRTNRGGEAFIASRHCQQCLFNRRGLCNRIFGFLIVATTVVARTTSTPEA